MGARTGACVSPQRLTLDGKPLEWCELHMLNEIYWRTHARDGELLPAPTSGACAHRVHKQCTGFRYTGNRYHAVGPCGCTCHEEGK